ncbi:MAG: hypothetical protein PHY15_08530 [Eubacteriales bacterium]|nr:hypothetical protein [Eubacteriales bacterium]
MKYRIKKSILPFLIISILLTGCGEHEKATREFGDVNPVESDSGANTAEYNIFTKLEEPLGYQYSTYENGKAKFSIPYPKTWSNMNDSDNHFIIAAPGDDLILKDFTIHILIGYDRVYEDPSADKAIKIFESNLHSLAFVLNDKGYVKIPFDNPDDYLTAENIIKNGPDKLFITMDENMEYMDLGGNYIKNGDQMINRCYYINWQGCPILIFGVGKTSDKEKICSLMDYMVSGMEYINEAKISRTKMISPLTDDFKITFSLPAEWEKGRINDIGIFNDAIKYSSQVSSSPYSGMTVSVYSAERDAIAELTKEYIKDNFLDTFAVNYYEDNLQKEDFFNDYYIEDSPAEGVMAGKDTKAFKAQTLIRKTNFDHSSIQDLTVHNSEVIVLYDDNALNFIVISSIQGQEDVAKNVPELIRTTIKAR